MAEFTPTQGRYLAFIHAYTILHGYVGDELVFPLADKSDRSFDRAVKRFEFNRRLSSESPPRERQ